MSTVTITSIRINKLEDNKYKMIEFIQISNVIPHGDKFDKVYDTKKDLIDRLNILIESVSRDNNHGCTQCKKGIQYLIDLKDKWGS